MTAASNSDARKRLAERLATDTAAPEGDWPCDDYEAPLTCFTTPKPKTLTCEGCRVAFSSGPEVRTHYTAAPVAVEGVETAEPLLLSAARRMAETHPHRHIRIVSGTGTTVGSFVAEVDDYIAARIVQARAGDGALRERDRLEAAVEAVLIADRDRFVPIPTELADALAELRRCRFGLRAALDTAGDPT